MVPCRNFQPARTDERPCKDADRSSSFDLELFQGKKAVQQWDRRRVEQENKSDYQKIVRISDAQNCKSVLISPAWRTPGTGFRPQILVKRLLFEVNDADPRWRDNCGIYTAMSRAVHELIILRKD